MAIVLNKPLPEFEANATSGLKVSNISHVGQTVVLFFYPKDNTPGCTTEAMQFRDKYKDFVKAGALVLGVSRDNMKSHDDFKAKLELPFELIADTEEKMCHMFGVVKNKIMYGKKVKGIERSTFLIGTDGTLKARVARPESTRPCRRSVAGRQGPEKSHCCGLMSPACVVTGLVHNDFMTLKRSPSTSHSSSRPGFRAAFCFLVSEFFNHLKAFVHAIATRSLPPRQPLDPHSL
jgi:thioredoxin-dependent peroxiredoxin